MLLLVDVVVLDVDVLEVLLEELEVELLELLELEVEVELDVLEVVLVANAESRTRKTAVCPDSAVLI